MEISANMVKDLRQKSGAGIMECKAALKETDGNIEDAIVYLRKKGIAGASKKMSRSTSEGTISSYIHQGGKIGVMLELNCETDFVAKTDKFQKLANDLCMHVAAANPLYLNRDEVPEEVLEKEKEIFSDQARKSGKPENIIPKIAEGKIEKFYKENCFLEQPFVKDQEFSIENLIKKSIAELGENISLKRFVRYCLGE